MKRHRAQKLQRAAMGTKESMMGAWGHGPFENDAALDWLSDTSGEEDDFRATFRAALDAGYLDVDVGSAAVAAAAVLASDAAALPARAAELRRNLPLASDIRALAVAALDAVGGSSSELSSLWGQEDISPWRTTLRDLRARLAPKAYVT